VAASAEGVVASAEGVIVSAEGVVVSATRVESSAGAVAVRARGVAQGATEVAASATGVEKKARGVLVSARGMEKNARRMAVDATVHENGADRPDVTAGRPEVRKNRRYSRPARAINGMKALERRSTGLLPASSCVDQRKGAFVMGTLNRPSLKARNVKVAAGTAKRITGATTLGGVVYTPAALGAVFADANAAIDRAAALHKEWQDQVAAARAAVKTAAAVFLLLRSYLVGQYGANANAVLDDFGMDAPKPRGPKTVATKLAAAQKRAATRALRHTMGKVQRKSVKGTVQVPVATGKPAS
jgi:hypothetical protein